MKNNEIDALMEDYVKGLYFGDITRLKKVFHPGAVYAYSVGQESRVLDMPRYFDLVQQRDSPYKRGESERFQVETLDWISETCVIVKARVYMLGRCYCDVLSLLYIDNRWVIVAKVFHYE